MLRILGLIFCALPFIPPIANGQELPTTLMCISNAKASRDFGFTENKWTGQKGHHLEEDQPFEIADKNSKVADTYFVLRDKVFSGLNTHKPIIRSVTKFKDETEEAAEFSAIVVSRTSDAVFLVWTNEANKVWLAAIDLIHRRATLTEVFQGLSSLGGGIETLDCR
jgi:hypothetical protein